MAYFDFNYVTDPPNDEFVDVNTQLNDNWDELDRKLTPFNQMPADFTGIDIPVGTEAFDPDPGHDDFERIAVWNGTNWVRCLNHVTPWTPWQLVRLREPIVERSGFTLKAKVNPISRRIVLMGGVLFDTDASAWPTDTTVEITADVSIQDVLAPVNGGVCVRQAATGQITTANGFASAVAIIEHKESPSRVAISVRYQGDAGGGNFVMFDGISWWY